ncbi:hypothetical protein AX15_003431 [Amanita polypyramis BW_CC]|nr:hypothetical protein AX15_003431 [Amanita polypyramis BW_CC]
MNPFQIEETRTPPVKSLRSKFEQLATSAGLAALSASTGNGSGAASAVPLQASASINGATNGKSVGFKPAMPSRPSMGNGVVGHRREPASFGNGRPSSSSFVEPEFTTLSTPPSSQFESISISAPIPRPRPTPAQAVVGNGGNAGEGSDAGIIISDGGVEGDSLSAGQSPLARPRASSSGTQVKVNGSVDGSIGSTNAGSGLLRASVSTADLRRPPPPAPTGIKRPPPPPPIQASPSSPSRLMQQSPSHSLQPQPQPHAPIQVQSQLQSSTSLTSRATTTAPLALSSSPSWGAASGGSGRLQSSSSRASSPSISPLLRPVLVPPASASTSSLLSGSLSAASSRPPSRNGLSRGITGSDESEGFQQISVASLRNRFNETPNTQRHSLNITYPSSDILTKPARPPRPSKQLDTPPLSSSRPPSRPEETTLFPFLSISPPRCMLSSPFSDDEPEVEHLNLTAPLIPIPVRKPPPPKLPAAVNSLDSHLGNSSQSSIDSASVASSGASTSSIQRPPPPRPPPRSRPKAFTVEGDSFITSAPILYPKSLSPPPLPSRRPNTVPLPDLEPSPLPSSALPPPPPRIATKSQHSSPQLPPTISAVLKQDSLITQSSASERKSLGSSKHLPPPTRTIALGDKLPPVRRPAGGSPPFSSDDESGEEGVTVEDFKGPGGDSLPDSSRSSRRPPLPVPFRDIQMEPLKIPIHAYSGHCTVAGSLVAVSHHHHIKIYDLSLTDAPVSTIDTKDLGLSGAPKITCMEMRSLGDGKLGQGCFVWVGTKEGHVFEVDLRTGAVCAVRQVAHLNPVTHILRHGRSMVTLDEGGKALIFSETEGMSLTGIQPRVMRITEKQEFARLLGGKLWTAARTDSQSGVGGSASSRLPIIRVYDLFVPGSTGRSVVPTEHTGAVTSAAVVPSRPGKVYVGHEEGYVSIWAVEGTEDGYPKCLEVVKVSTSDILCVEGVNDRLWVGSRNGMISAYEVATRPWVVTNSWSAHPGLPVLRLAVDVFGIDEGKLNVASVGRDDTLRFWDGMLRLDWIDNEVQKRESSFSSFRDVTALIVSWNCDATRPDSLTGDPANVNLFGDVLSSVDEPPDVIAFGFQEVIDLESRKMAAKNVLLGGAGKKKHHDEGVTGIACSGNGLSDKVTGAYRRWYDRLVREVRVGMPNESYTVVYTESLVGLFSCIFIKTSERFGLRDVAVTTIKRGMGGRYGNKGGIVARFVIGDSSVCMINCHLAAGQNAVRRRNADIAAILEEKAVFPPADYPLAYGGGGDGTMILDHEFVFVNGDMNYRIDHRREAIISSIRTGEFTNLLAHDQLLREIKSNRACRFRGFSEGPITFAPTYKYDPRSNEYDSSEKRRLPAWCDRVLWRTRDGSRVQQLHYQRYEANVSDHRPVSAAFGVTVKTIVHDRRGQVVKQVQSLWAEEQARLLAEARDFYRLSACL